MEEAEFNNVTVQEFLTTAEFMILANPDKDGIELTDSEGRVWFLQLLENNASTIN